MTNLEKLEHVFRSALTIPASDPVATIEYGKTKGWDSVAHMQLVAAVESAFDVMLDTEDVIGMSSFGEAVRILDRLGIVS